MPTLVKEGEEEHHNKMEDVDWNIYILNLLFLIISFSYYYNLKYFIK